MKLYRAGNIEIAFIPWDNWEFRKVDRYKLGKVIMPKLKEMGDFRLPSADEINYICREIHEKLGVGKFYNGQYWYGLYKETEAEREESHKRFGFKTHVPLEVSVYWLDDSKRNFDRYTPPNMVNYNTEGSVIAVRDI